VNGAILAHFAQSGILPGTVSAAVVRSGWSPSRVRRQVEQDLTSLLDRARALPFHRPRLGTAHGLGDAPIMSRVHVRELFASVPPQRGTLVASTSGSSGEPVRVRHDRASIRSTRLAHLRAFRWHGVDPFLPRVVLLRPPPPPSLTQRIRQWARTTAVDLATSRTLLSLMDMSPSHVRHVAGKLRGRRDFILTTYPSLLEDFLLQARALGVDPSFRPALIHCQSEELTPRQRELFEDTFGGVPILNEYGCVEVGAMAHSCPEGRLHPAHDHVVLEVVDGRGRAVPPGESGRILLTPLHAHVMPLLRYEVGDSARVAATPCGCGIFRGLPSLEAIEGRTFQTIVDRHGQRISGGIVHFVMKSLPHEAITAFRAVQRRVGELDIQVVVGAEARAEVVVSSIREGADRIFGDRLEVRVTLVDTIDFSGKRKRMYFVSELEETT